MPDATGGFGHVPVLLDRCFELLHPALTRHHADGSGAVLVDGTVGAGGHAERFLTELPGLRLIGVDRDPTALDIVRARLCAFRRPAHPGANPLRRHRARLWPNRATDQPNPSTACFSISVSRPCNSTVPSEASPTRRTRRWTCGWTPPSPLTAAEILNTYDEAALSDILRRYGEEKLARRIATHIVRRRARSPFTSTAELVEVDLPSGSGSGPSDRRTSRPSGRSRRCASRSTANWMR